MKLIKARLRGLDTLTETRWFDLSPRLNLFQFAKPRQGRNFLRILQTINPTYAIKTEKPFAGFQEYQEPNGYRRRVNPAKRTVALAVFDVTSGLVEELSAASDLLYQTDRIEVGRRLDSSRWINFVEVASSTRWGTISDDMKALLHTARRVAPGMVPSLSGLIDNLQPSDRIKGGIKDQLSHWLKELPPEVQQESKKRIEALRTGVHRVDHFEAARAIVRTRMPLFVVLGTPCEPAGEPDSGILAGLDRDSASFAHLLQCIAERANVLAQKSASEERAFLRKLNDQLGEVQPPAMMLRLEKSAAGAVLLKNDKPVSMASDGPLFALRRMQAKACLAVALSRIVSKTEAILMFDDPERGLPEALHQDLVDFVTHISKSSQCLYAYSRSNIFRKDAAVRQYTTDDLAMATG